MKGERGFKNPQNPVNIVYGCPLGWMLPPKPAFMKFTTTPVIRAMTFTKQVFQDIVLPINKYVK